MSLEKALKTLVSLGLNLMDAQVYVYLAKKGPRERNDLAESLGLPRNQLDLCLENLMNKGIIKTVSEGSDRYFAISFEKVLDDFMKATREKAKALQASKKELLSSWRSMIENNSSNN